MQSSPEQAVLECEGCGEKLILLGFEEDWRPRRAVFRCACGRKLPVDDRAEEEARACRQGLLAPPRRRRWTSPLGPAAHRG